MYVVIFWCTLHGCCHFLVHSGCMVSLSGQLYEMHKPMPPALCPDLEAKIKKKLLANNMCCTIRVDGVSNTYTKVINLQLFSYTKILHRLG